MDNIYGLYKRIAKRDITAIDEIESLEQAKSIIKMLVGPIQGLKIDTGLYPVDFDKIVKILKESCHRYE